MEADAETGAIEAIRGELEVIRTGLTRIERELEGLAPRARSAPDRARPIRYYEVLVGVYEHGRHGIDADALAELAGRHHYDRRGLNGFFTGARAALRRRDDRVVLTAEGERLVDVFLRRSPG